MKNRLSPLLFLASLFGAALAGAAAMAQEHPQQARLNITPLRLELPVGQAATQMLVRNQGDKQIAVQMRVFEWTQDDGENHYAPSRDVAVSPSIVKIDPGLAQSFHVLSRPGTDPSIVLGKMCENTRPAMRIIACTRGVVEYGRHHVVLWFLG